MIIDQPCASVCERLIAPRDVDAFFREHWERSATYVAGPDDKFRNLYDVDRDRWIEHAAELEAATEDDRGVQHQTRIARSQIGEHFNAGMTICANVTLDPTLSPLLRRFAHELALAGAPFAKLYASPHDKGFALHFDAFHVFVCQLSGSKRWRFSRTPAIEAPLHSGKLDGARQPIWSQPIEGALITDDSGIAIEAPDENALEEVVLTPGDCLYLPPGTWHVARALGRSVALSISPPRASVFQLFAKALEDHLTLRAEWRRDVFSRDRSALVPNETAAMFRDRLADLRALIDGFDLRAIHRIWRINTSAHELPADDERGPIAEGDTLVHVGDAVRRHLIAPGSPGGADAIHFYAGGSEWSLPIAARRFVERLAATPELRLEDARTFDPSLSESDVREILDQLLAAHLVAKRDQG